MIRWPRLFLLLALLASPWALYPAWQYYHRPPPPPAAPAPKPAAPRPFTITVVGDLLLAARVAPLAAREPGFLFAGLDLLLRQDDLTIGNLECAVATSGRPEVKEFTFRARPPALRQLTAGGVDAVSLANNHSQDYGHEALVETFGHLHAAGIPWAGAGRDADAAYRPQVLQVRGRKVALLAASRVLPSGTWYAEPGHPGLAQVYEPTRLLAEVRRVRPQVDIVLVYLHWGIERMPVPFQWQRNLAKRLIEAGADAILGSHPHVLQGFEIYRGKPIAYSLGNFVFTDRNKPTVALQLTFGDRVSARAIPCRILNCRPHLVRDARGKQAIWRSLQAASYGVRLDGEGRILPAKR